MKCLEAKKMQNLGKTHAPKSYGFVLTVLICSSFRAMLEGGKFTHQ